MKKARVFSALLIASLAACMLTGCSKIKEVTQGAEEFVSKAEGWLNDVDGLGDKAKDFVDDLGSGEIKREANVLNDTLKSFYSGVLSGDINATTKGYLVKSADLPKQKATSAERREAAKQLTVMAAIESQGMQARFTDEVLDKLVFVNGKVEAKASDNSDKGMPITLDTTLGSLYG